MTETIRKYVTNTTTKFVAVVAHGRLPPTPHTQHAPRLDTTAEVAHYTPGAHPSPQSPTLDSIGRDGDGTKPPIPLDDRIRWTAKVAVPPPII